MTWVTIEDKLLNIEYYASIEKKDISKDYAKPYRIYFNGKGVEQECVSFGSSKAREKAYEVLMEELKAIDFMSGSKKSTP